MKDEVQYLIWLSGILRPVKVTKLLKRFGCAKDIYYADEKELMQVDFLNSTDIANLIHPKFKERLKVVLDRTYRHGIKVMTLLDEEYPAILKNIYDPPCVLYYKGEIDKEAKALAVVGARKATYYGLEMSEVISKKLVKHGFYIASGMARGVDSAAHRATLQAGGKTYAVLGCGIDIVYPAENRGLMERIVENGAVISEFMPGTHPFAYHFPQRNRIISGLSMGVIVIEAGEKSGSLITANLALEQGREVFALPGNVISTKSTGTNRLIKEGAKMVTGIDDILEELVGFGRGEAALCHRREEERKWLKEMSLEERKVFLAIEEGDIHIDQLMHKTGLSLNQLNAYLIMLELSGRIEQLPGKVFRSSMHNR